MTRPTRPGEPPSPDDYSPERPKRTPPPPVRLPHPPAPGSRRIPTRRHQGRRVRSRSRGHIPTLRPSSLRTPRPRLPRRHLSSRLRLSGSRRLSPRSRRTGTNLAPGNGGRVIPRADGMARATGARTGQVPRLPRARDTCRHRTPRFERLIRRRRRSCRHRPGIRSKAIRSLMTSLRRHRVRPRPGAGRRTAAGRRTGTTAPGSSRFPARSPTSLAPVRRWPSTRGRT